MMPLGYETPYYFNVRNAKPISPKKINPRI